MVQFLENFTGTVAMIRTEISAQKDFCFFPYVST